MLDIQNSVSSSHRRPNLVLVGKLGKPYGTDGKIKLHSFCLDPRNIETFACLYSEKSDETFKLLQLIEAGEEYIAKIEGIRSRVDATQLQGTKLFASREEFPDLEENEYYYSDLQDLRAQDTEGNFIGTVASMNNFGAGDLMELLLDESGNRVFIPFTKENVVSVNISQGFLEVENVEDYL